MAWKITNTFGEVNTSADVRGIGAGFWQHTSVDFLLDGRSSLSQLQTVYAAGAGVVVFSTNSNSDPAPTARRGGLVIIRHLAPVGGPYQNPGYEKTFTARRDIFTISTPPFETQEILTYYLHLDPDEVFVSQGDQVKVGQPIGRLYSARRVGKKKEEVSFVPHLHFEVWKGCSEIEHNGYDEFGAQFQQAVTDLLMDPVTFLRAPWRVFGHDRGHTWSSPFEGPEVGFRTLLELTSL